MSTFSIGTGEKAKANGARPEDFRHDYGKAGVRKQRTLDGWVKTANKMWNCQISEIPI